MRTILWLLPAALLFAVPAASAAGCSADAPCRWVVDLDEDGIQDKDLEEARYNGTVGDWYVIDLYNLDDAQHTLSFEGYDLEWTVAGVDGYVSDPFQLDRAGEFRLLDQPSGDSAPATVYANDVVDVEQGQEGVTQDPGEGEEDDGNDTPAPGLALVVGAVALAVVLRRR